MATVEISGLTKTYASGFHALKGVDLSIEEGEILALLGPNGAGKTTLISTVCGISVPTGGSITVDGFDAIRDFRATRRLVGLVPQEVNLEPFEKVITTVRYSRGIFGLRADEAKVEEILKKLSLWEKRNEPIRSLSGGMKRRVLIAKALAHEPKVLFLDEPTAGVDVELRRDMWGVVEELRRGGVTIILTTHYIEEAEAIADRIAVINDGRILLVEDKDKLMTRMGQKTLTITLNAPIDTLPDAIAAMGVTLSDDGESLVYGYDKSAERTGIGRLIAAVTEHGLSVRDVATTQNSLEDIFVGLVHGSGAEQGDAA